MSSYSRNIRNATISNGLSRYRYFRPRARRSSFGYPWYSYPRRRPTLSDRDRRFRDWLREKLKERERINREEEHEDTDEEEIEQPEVPETNLSRKLHVTGLDLHIAENTQKHHTDMYECTEDRYRESDRTQQEAELVIRRGQPFLITVRFDRPYDVKKNDITLTFTLAAAEEGNSTVKESFKVTESKNTSYRPRKWGANLVKKDCNSLVLEVFAPASVPIGEWQVSVRTIVDVTDGKDLIWQYNHNEEIIILFNPWCREDVVYMSDQTWLNEAVLNDSGAVYFGNSDQIGSRSWYYGQFEDGMLDAALHLVRRGFDFKTSKAMGNAVRVARVMSKIVNAPDDDGVLVGNWSDDYSGGSSPTAWAGSVKILRQYMRTGKPVKYAQCWVYSHVLTTVCRALGIPCRSLTNFDSAHNTDKDHLSHDTVYIRTVTGEIKKLPSGDSIWNFHVWNDVWMSRPDLGREFDGWQAIDATPQEKSDGAYCCGPSPLNAIKEGLINVGQDTAFVFSEVNSDKVSWMMNPNTLERKVIERVPNAIGIKISTHEPTGRGDQVRLDITDQYKHPEGSKREREVVKKAEKLFRADNLDDEDEEPPEPKPLELIIEKKDDIFVGSGFDVEVTAVNSNDSPRTVQLSVKVSYNTYFGVTTGLAAKKKFPSEKLGPGEHKSFILNVSAKAALQHPKDGFNFYIQALADVAETDNIVTEIASFRLRRPDINIKGPSTAKVGETFDVDVSFTNPLSVLMTNCEVEIEGNLKTMPAAADHLRIGAIRPGETWRTTIKMTAARAPRQQKERTGSFGLESDQLGEIVGTYNMTLK